LAEGSKNIPLAPFKGGILGEAASKIEEKKRMSESE